VSLSLKASKNEHKMQSQGNPFTYHGTKLTKRDIVELDLFLCDLRKRYRVTKIKNEVCHLCRNAGISVVVGPHGWLVIILTCEVVVLD
jgi:hypothetical protein